MSLFVGIDVGGTNTDAVVVSVEDSQYRVVAARKAPSTKDGVVEALKAVMPSVRQSNQNIVGVFVGTTQFVNAILERSERLSKVVSLVFVTRPSASFFTFLQLLDCVSLEWHCDELHFAIRVFSQRFALSRRWRPVHIRWWKSHQRQSACRVGR